MSQIVTRPSHGKCRMRRADSMRTKQRMPKTLSRIVCLLLVVSLSAGRSSGRAGWQPFGSVAHQENLVTAEALAIAPAAFHHNRTAILVCGLATSIVIGG